MDTERLINALESDLTPVEPLPAPWHRLINWLAINLPIVAFFALAIGFRSDLAVKLAEPSFLAQQIAMLATVILAGWAAMSAVVPGTRRSVFWIPAIALAAWIATLGQQCWEDWIQWGRASLEIGLDLKCVSVIATIGIIPIVTMIVMLRKGAAYRSLTAVWWGTLASAALANASLRLVHAEDAGMMVVVWQFGSVLVFSVLATQFKDRLMPPRHPVQVTA
jgi:hypothetical protein